MKPTIESDWEALLTEMRKAREYGVPGIGAREIADVERKLEKIRRRRENMRAVALMFLRDKSDMKQPIDLPARHALVTGGGPQTKLLP
jgi:hypothetical protein